MALIYRATTTDPFTNLATEAALCAVAAAENTPILFLWQNAPCVVIGRNQNPWLECNLAAMEADDVLLTRRQTGGGAVYHDVGNLNYSFCLPESQYDEEKQYGVILNALQKLGICAERNGRNDLTVDGKKISGSAFLHRDGAGLHHGTLLVRSDLTVFSRYLTPEQEKFAAKGVRSVASRVTNLSEFVPGISVDTLSRAIETAFTETYGSIEPNVPIALDLLKSLREEFCAWEFRYGKTPRFDREFRMRFPFGGIRLQMTVSAGVITACTAYSDLLDTEFPAKLADALCGARLHGAALATAAKPICGEIYAPVLKWLEQIDQ